MHQNTLTDIIADQTDRALWEVKNVMDCVPEENWRKKYCGMPIWKHIYHMLHSLDLWLINPRESGFLEPSIHEKDLNNLDVLTEKELTRAEIDGYFSAIKEKITRYIATLTDEQLLEYPECAEYTRFTLIIAQHRHLSTHMGMLMGFIIADTGLWPRVVGLEGSIPDGAYNPFYPAK